MSSKTEQQVHRGWTAALAATTVVALLLRLVGLSSPLWYDELLTLVDSIRSPLWTIVSSFPNQSAHPLYSVLAHLSSSLFGETAWSLRLPAALFGTASVAMAYRLGRVVLTRAESWAAAAILATSYHHVWFSQNARGYTLLGFFALVSTWLLVRAARSGSTSDLAWYAVASALGVYTHMAAAFVVVGHSAVLLAGLVLRWQALREWQVPRLLVACVAAGALSLLLYAPFIPGVIGALGASSTHEAAQVATPGWALAEALRSLVSGTGVVLPIAAAALAMFGGVSLWRRQPVFALLLVSPAVFTLAGLVLMGQPVRPRFFFFLSGAAALCVGRGLGLFGEWLSARRPGLPASAAVVVATLALACASAPSLLRNYQVPKQDLDGAVRLLDDAARRGVSIAVAGPACLPMARYYKRDWQCLETEVDWRELRASGVPTLVVYTLTDYFDHPPLAVTLRAECQLEMRFPGTLGGGDVVVCATPVGAAP